MKINRNALYRIYCLINKIGGKKPSCKIPADLGIFTAREGDNLVISAVVKNKSDTLVAISIKQPIIDSVIETQISYAALEEITKGAAKCLKTDIAEVVSLEAPDGLTKCEIRWARQGPPNTTESIIGSSVVPLIQPPKNAFKYGRDMLRIFGEAFECSDSDDSRYALGGVLIDGEAGAIVSTDAKQCYVQAGYKFPFSRKMLFPFIPAVFDGFKKSNERDFVFGNTEDGQFYLAYGDVEINIAQLPGRFPRWQLVSKFGEEFDNFMKIEISEGDAQKFLEMAGRLPNKRYKDDTNNKELAPVYLHCSETTTIDAYDRTQSGISRHSFVLHDTKCSLPEKEFIAAVNRTYLIRALRFGFRKFYLKEHTLAAAKSRVYDGCGEPKRVECDAGSPLYFVSDDAESTFVVMPQDAFSEPLASEVIEVEENGIGELNDIWPLNLRPNSKAVTLKSKPQRREFAMTHIVAMKNLGVLVALKKSDSPIERDGQRFYEYHEAISSGLGLEADWQISEDGKTVIYRNKTISDAELVDLPNICRLYYVLKKDLYNAFAEKAKSLGMAPNRYLHLLIEDAIK